MTIKMCFACIPGAERAERAVRRAADAAVKAARLRFTTSIIFAGYRLKESPSSWYDGFPIRRAAFGRWGRMRTRDEPGQSRIDGVERGIWRSLKVCCESSGLSLHANETAVIRPDDARRVQRGLLPSIRTQSLYNLRRKLLLRFLILPDHHRPQTIMKLSLALLPLVATSAWAGYNDYHQADLEPENAVYTQAPPEEKPKAQSFLERLQHAFDLEAILTSGPVVSIAAKAGINITEKVQAAKAAAEGSAWNHHIPLITDENYRETIVEEPLSLDELDKRVWFLLM